MRISANQSSVRINNQHLIIEYLKYNGPKSRAELSKILSISKPTVSTNVEALLSLNILIEKGSGPSSGGRIPTLVAFNKSFKCILAMDLNRNKPLIALCDLSGKILARESVNLSVAEASDIIMKKITDTMNHLLENHLPENSELGVVSIAIPGVVDDSTGQISANIQFNHWTKLNIKEILGGIYHVPVVIKNDISMAAVGEKYYGAGKAYDDIAYVSVGRGVGAGLILNNKLFEGKRKAAGEIGYSRLFSHQGNLEEELSTDVMLKKMTHDLEANVDSVLQQWTKDEALSIEMIKKALIEKDSYATSVVKKTGEVLGIVMANMALVLDLELIVVGGLISEFGEVLLNEIKKVSQEILPFDTQIKLSELGSMAGTYGLMHLGEEIIMKDMVV